MQLDAGTILLIIIGTILAIALFALLGGGMAVGGMAMMAGMMSTPVGWILLLILLALIGLVGYIAIFAG
jgi:hypothetical protein